MKSLIRIGPTLCDENSYLLKNLGHPLVNFINIICANISYERHFGSFFSTYVHITLMKLTPGVLNVILLDAVEGLLSHPDLSLNFGTFTVRNNLPYAVAQTTGSTAVV